MRARGRQRCALNRALVFGAALAVTFAAKHAEAFDFGTPEQKTPYKSPQNFAFELRVGPYLPNVDSEPGLHGTPFKNSFGTGPRIYIGGEFDWQMYRIPWIGTIGPAFQVGHIEMGRDARTITGRASGDSYSLTIYPFYLDVVLRIDTLWRNLGFPAMPYLKGGMAVGLWNASNSSGTATANGVKGSGATWGPAIAAGMAFPLDFFDHGSSRAMDATTGINSTSVYAEYYWLDLAGFGQSHPLYIGDHSWVVGMMFEF